MSEWTAVKHREEVEIRVADEGEVVSTLAGPQHASTGDFVLRRRVIPADASDMDTDELAKLYVERYHQPPSSDAEREDLYQSLWPWDVRRCDPEYAEHHFRVEDLDIQEELEPDEGQVALTVLPYEDWTVAELKAEIEERNSQRDSFDDHISPEAPGNKPELIAALEADDARASQE